MIYVLMLLSYVSPYKPEQSTFLISKDLYIRIEKNKDSILLIVNRNKMPWSEGFGKRINIENKDLLKDPLFLKNHILKLIGLTLYRYNKDYDNEYSENLDMIEMFFQGHNPVFKYGDMVIKLRWIFKSKGNDLMEGINPTQDGMIEIKGHKGNKKIKQYPEGDLISWDPKYWMEGSLLKLYTQRIIRELFEQDVIDLLMKRHI